MSLLPRIWTLRGARALSEGGLPEVARSIALIELGSNGWIVSDRGSGALIVASCLSGVWVP